MLPKISNALFILSLVASLAFLIHGVMSWQTPPDVPRLADATEEMMRLHIILSSACAVLLFFAYLLSFDPHRPRRPWLLLIPATLCAGATAGVPLRESFSAYSIVLGEWPAFDRMAWLVMVGGGGALTAVVLVFEGVNRLLWGGLSRWFDQKNLSAPALFCSRLLLLFRPGQTGMLRSVTLARFRRGARGEVVTFLEAMYEEGKADPEVLEALCKAANERGDRVAYLGYLRELHNQLPDEEEIGEILIEELVTQEQYAEALELIRAAGVPDEDEDGLERYAHVLLSLGHLDETIAVARRLGESEGIPFRRSQALLREVLGKAPESLPALNALAAQAERMALREQMLRWLEKSIQADPAQRDVRRRLINTYRDMGQTKRLEELLEQSLVEDPRDAAVEFEYIRVIHANGRTGKALERLRRFNQGERASAASHLLEAEIQFEQEEYESARLAGERALQETPAVDERKKIEQLLKKIEEAVFTVEVVECLEAARENPDDIDMQMEALQMLIDGGHTGKVVAQVDQILGHHPGARDDVAQRLSIYMDKVDVPFPILNLLGDLLSMSGRHDDTLQVVRLMAERSLDKVTAARTNAQKILSRSPHHLPTLRFLGEVYRQHGRFTDMIHTFTLYLGHGGEETAEIIGSLANAYMALEDYPSARPYVAKLLEENPRDIALLERMIPFAINTGHAADAAEYLGKLELAQPTNKMAKRWREQIDNAIGQERFHFLKKEIDAGKGGAETLEQLGDLARGLENFNEAITCYQRASRDSSNPARARRCTAKLAHAYLNKRLDDLCAETLRNVQISIDDDPEELAVLMDILYQVGDLFLEYKHYDRAQHVFKQLCKIDAGYRDVLAKVEKLNM